MAKVYLSSTVADLGRERRAAMDWLVAARHQPIHSYVPSSETVRDSVLDDVDACDLHVLILGHRYGFVPEDGNPEGLSITHLEFRRAGQSGIPRIALLLSGVPSAGLPGTEDAHKAALVAAFRAEVTRAVRAAEFGDLPGLIQGLSTGVQAELDKLPSAGPVLRLAPRPPCLAGREELLAELDARLTGGGDAGPRVVALCGLGGAGKTSVALEYAHRHLAGVGVAWQFPAEDRSVLAAGFAELGTQLGVLGPADGRDPVASVHSALASYRGGWLLVFDNAPDQASVAQFVPPAGRGRVLITSRNPSWPPSQALDVPVLGPEAAARFLADRTGDQDRQAALELASELGGLPLALEQAAAYIQASGDSVAGYSALFRRRRTEMLARGEPAGSSKTVATTWTLAFEHLQEAAPRAVGLLRLLAFCAPEAIPLYLLLQPRPGLGGQLGPQVAPVLVPLLEDELAAKDAIAAVRRHSLLTAAEDRSVSMHRLVQAVTIDQMPRDLVDQWHQATDTLIEAAIPADTDRPETWPICAALLPHAQAALADDSAGMDRIANYLGQRGSYASAREIQQRIVDAREQSLGPEHPDTLAARGNLAHWTGEAGDIAGAFDQLAAQLPAHERVLGPEHPGTLTVRDNLAHWAGAAGDAAAARDQYAALLPIRERVCGPEHPQTLTDRANLAYWTGAAGDAAAARDQDAALLPIRERVSGPEHPDTLTVRSNLAYWTGLAGDAAAARDQYTALVPVNERVLGAEHPATLAERNNLARWTGEAGDTGAACDQFAALVPVYERVFGPEHPNTLTVRGAFARWTGQAGDIVSARDQLAALLPVRERVLGPEHPDTLATRVNLAAFTGMAGDAASARDQYTALLPVMERVFGPEHPDTLNARHNLAEFARRSRRRWRVK